MSGDKKLSTESTTTSTTPATGLMNHTEAEEEEELGIYSDDDESAGDLSDDEPPLTDQDISGRPQSQFKLRVMSAVAQYNYLPEARGPTQQHSNIGQQHSNIGQQLTNHIDASSATNVLTEESCSQLTELEINSEQPSTRQRHSSDVQQDDVEQQSNRAKDTKVK